MSKELSIVTVSGVRGYEKDGTVYLNVEDTARGLGFTTVATSGNVVVRWSRVHQHLVDFGVATSCNGDYQANCPEFIPENIFYRLAMKAKNEVAEKFQAKVADEILPAIRKTGMYMTTEAIEKWITAPETMLQVLNNWKKDRDKLVEAEATIERMTPAANLGTAVSSTPACISVKDLAHLITQNGTKIGQNRLYQWLVDHDYLYRQGRKYRVYQEYLERGLFQVQEQVYNFPGTEIEQINLKVMVTGKGQDYFLDLFKQTAE